MYLHYIHQGCSKWGNILHLTLVQIRGRYCQNTASWRLVLRDLGVILALLKPGHLIININHIDTQQLAWWVLRYPMIFCDYCEVKDVLLLTVQRLENRQRACGGMDQRWNVRRDFLCMLGCTLLQPVSPRQSQSTSIERKHAIKVNKICHFPHLCAVNWFKKVVVWGPNQSWSPSHTQLCLPECYHHHCCNSSTVWPQFMRFSIGECHSHWERSSKHTL